MLALSSSGRSIRQLNGSMRYYASGIEYAHDRKVDLIHPEEVEKLRGLEVEKGAGGHIGRGHGVNPAAVLWNIIIFLSLNLNKKILMSIESRKLKIISWVSEINDESILAKIEQLKPPKKDWWDTISDQEKEEIQQGLAQADNGELKTSEEVLAKYRKWDTK